MGFVDDCVGGYEISWTLAAAEILVLDSNWCSCRARRSCLKVLRHSYVSGGLIGTYAQSASTGRSLLMPYHYALKIVKHSPHGASRPMGVGE